MPSTNRPTIITSGKPHSHLHLIVPINYFLKNGSQVYACTEAHTDQISTFPFLNRSPGDNKIPDGSSITVNFLIGATQVVNETEKIIVYTAGLVTIKKKCISGRI